MSEKNKTKIEKKLIATIALIVTIGIATIVPLTFVMSNTARAQTNITDPLFNIAIPFAYYNADVTYNVEINSVIDGGHSIYDVWYRDAAVIAAQPSINLDVLGNDTVARIEFFEYTVYTDKLQLQKSYSYFAYNEEAFEQYSTGNFVTEYYRNNLQDVLTRTGSDYFGGFGVTDPEDSMFTWIAGNSQNHQCYNELAKHESDILTAIANTQTVYVDVKRVAFVSVDTDGKLMVVEDNKLVQHIELTKSDDGFLYGNPADIGREVYIGLPKIPYNGTDVPEEFWPIIWPDKFGA
jgi:hypothetical protein